MSGDDKEPTSDAADETGRLAVRREEYASDAGRRWLRIQWTEAGIDPQVEQAEGPLHKSGYGRKLIQEALPYALNAWTSDTLGQDRLDCTVDMPLDR